jgi:hypothetical protein
LNPLRPSWRMDLQARAVLLAAGLDKGANPLL